MTRLQKLTRDIDANLLYLTSLDKASPEAVELRTKTAALIMDRATLTIGQEQEEVDA